MAVISMKQLLEAGVHFGHQTRRWNPKMKRFIHGERSGIHIVDLHQTLTHLESSYVFVRDLVANGGTVLFIGTKKQAQDSIQSYAERCNMPYINERWLGGMLTNFQTISKRVSKMQEYRRMRDSGEFEAMPKKEALLISRELPKLERNLGGIRDMQKLPDAVFGDDADAVGGHYYAPPEADDPWVGVRYLADARGVVLAHASSCRRAATHVRFGAERGR